MIEKKTLKKRKKNTPTLPSRPSSVAKSGPASVQVEDESDQFSFDPYDEPASKQLYFKLLNEQNLCHYHGHNWFVMPVFDHVKKQVNQRNYCHVQVSKPFPKCTCQSSLILNHNDYVCEHIEFIRLHRSHHTSGNDNNSSNNLSIHNSAVDNFSTSNSFANNSSPTDNIVTDSFATDNFATYGTTSTDNSTTSNSISSNSATDNNPVKLIFRSDDDSGFFLRCVFSVITSSISHPAIVWKRNEQCRLSCQKSGCGGRSKCQHVLAVEKFVGEEDIESDDEDDREDTEPQPDKPPFVRPKSIRPVPVPEWVRISSDTLQYSTDAPLEYKPLGTVLGESKCQNCDVNFFDEKFESVLPSCCSYRSATIYYLEFGVPIQLRTTKCPQCDFLNEYDGLEDRIFNFNGSLLFSHHLLNQYTSRYSSSQTTLTSFRRCVNNSYLERNVLSKKGKTIRFVSSPTFNLVWFSFIKLQDWKYSYQCDVCGPHPDNVIADSITLSLPTANCPLETLRPPTFVDPLSTPVEIPESTRHIHIDGESNEERVRRCSRGHRYSHDMEIRKTMSIYTGKLFQRYKRVEPLSSAAIVNLIKQCDKNEPEFAAMIKLIEHMKGNNVLTDNSLINNSPINNSAINNSAINNSAINNSAINNSAINNSAINNSPSDNSTSNNIVFSNSASNNFTSNNSTSDNSASDNSAYNNSVIDNSKPIIRILLRLLRILASDEPLLQFLHHPAPILLRKCTSNLSLFSRPEVLRCLEVMCPFVHELLREFGDAEKVPTEVWNLLREAARRAEVMVQLAGNRQLPPLPPLTDSNLPQCDDVESGSYYGMKKVRSRPLYSKDADGESVGCEKVFPEYRGITGGAMILWCRHRIAQGFHVIKKGEGRNDMFSALYCHWPSAPRVVCYDNACQLMHYATIREPVYFKNTTFVIDRLHQKNHYACSEAFGLRPFMEGGAKEFFQFNDSAAETGNALLKRIRTSCLYMGKTRFMLFVRLFLEVQNRNRIRLAAKMTAKAQGSCSSRTSCSSSSLNPPMRASVQNYEYLIAIVNSL